MKKILALILACILLVFLVSCGSDGKDAGSPDTEQSGNTDADTSEDTAGVPIDQFSEKYVCIYMDAFGSALTDLDILKDYTIELKGDGTGALNLDGIANEFTWKVEDGKIIITSYQDTVATVDGDVITIDDWMGQGVAYKFAKEGSEAANTPIAAPLDEDEAATIGTWTSYAVYDLLDDDISDEVDADGITLVIKDDRTVDIEAFGEDLGNHPWESFLGSYTLSDESYDFDWELGEDGDLVVTVILEDESYAVFHCEKN